MSAAFAPPSPKPVTTPAVITASITCQKWPRIAPALFIVLSLTLANFIEVVWRNIDVSVITVGRKSVCRGPDRDGNGARGALAISKHSASVKKQFQLLRRRDNAARLYC